MNSEIIKCNNDGDELLNEIGKNVKLIDENIIVLREIENTTVESVNIQFDKVEELIEDLDSYYFIIDLSAANTPDAQTRKVINKRFEKVAYKMNHTAYCVGKNILVKTAIYFVMYASRNDSFSIHEMREEAIKKCKDARSKY